MSTQPDLAVGPASNPADGLPGEAGVPLPSAAAPDVPGFGTSTRIATMQAKAASSFTDTSHASLSGEVSAAPFEYASIGDMALQLRQGYWASSGQCAQSFNMSDTGIAAKGGVLHHNCSGFSNVLGRTDTDGISAAGKALVEIALQYIVSVPGIRSFRRRRRRPAGWRRG